MADPETSYDLKPETRYDLYFILRRGTTMMNAIAALTDTGFNPSALALIQAGQAGLEITVHVTDTKTNKPVFGFLRFNATGLEDFKCKDPFTKLVSLLLLHNVLQAATKYEDRDYISVYVVSGSNQLSFFGGEISLDFEPELEEWIGLSEVESEYGTFPDVTYGFEAVIPSRTLNNTINQVLQMDPHTRPTQGLVTMTAATVVTELKKDVVVSTEEDPEMHDVWMQWKYWESLQKALCLADNCSMYLVTDPPEHIMFRFKLQELGDLVYLTPASFDAVSELPTIDRFCSLLA